MKNTTDSHLRVRALTEGAIFVALAFVLSFVKLYELPNGGSLTPAMFPILFYALRFGLGRGMAAGFVFGLLQLLFDGAYAWGWQSMIGDYLLAFMVLGVAGLFWKQKGGFFIGATVGSLARFLVHFVVGATIWAAYMPDSFFGMTMTSPWFYSFLYNGSYMVIDYLLILLIGAVLQKSTKQIFRPQC